MKEELIRKNCHTKLENEMKDILCRVWNSISIEACQKLIYSMSERLQAVIDADGYATHY